MAKFDTKMASRPSVVIVPAGAGSVQEKEPKNKLGEKSVPGNIFP